jgi:hypothetical protein
MPRSLTVPLAAALVACVCAVFTSAALGGTSSPCKLVSAKQVGQISGHQVTKTTLAPLGPTCIWTLRHATEITLSTERQSASALAREMRSRRAVTVARHHGYCGKLGGWEVELPVSSGRVLVVTAACSVAERIAAIAIPHL